jgi:hypothetical protein
MTLTIREGVQAGEARRAIRRAGGLASASDLARRWGLSPTRVGQLADQDGFPEPVGHVAGGRPVWAVNEADAWRARRQAAARRARAA